jgi:hypothetical protein
VNYYPQLRRGCLRFATGTGVNEQVGLLEDMVLAGGCAKNESLAKALEQRLRVKMKALPMNPQIGVEQSGLMFNGRLVRISYDGAEVTIARTFSFGFSLA